MKSNSKTTMTGFAVLLLLYQAWRVYDYMSTSLMGVSDTVKFIVSVAFLGFSEVGLMVWLHIGQPSATTDEQETVSTVMVWADFLGSMMVGLGDMLKHNTMYDVDLSVIDPLLFLAPWIMVVLNIAGYIIYHTNDSEAQLDREERRLHHQENKLEMAARSEAVRQLNANKRAMAEKLAPHYYRDILNRVNGRTLNRFENQDKGEDLPPKQDDKPSWLESLFDKLTASQTTAVYNQVAPAADKAVEANGGNTSRAADDSITDSGKTVNPTKPRKAG